MDAKELLVLIDDVGLLELVARSAREKDGWIQQTILRALSLLAAAEANDGTTPETDAAIDDWSKRADDVILLKLAKHLERERNAALREVDRVFCLMNDNQNAYCSDILSCLSDEAKADKVKP